MSKIKGTVSGVGKGKFSFFITLESKDGFYFNTKYEPKCGKGDVVGIEYEQKAENRGNVKRVEVLTDNGAPKGVQGGSGGGGSGGGGGETSTGKQNSIVWQHSQEMALLLVATLLANEAFGLKGKADQKRVQIEELVDELTVRLFKDASNPLDSEAYKTVAGIEGDTDGESESGEAEAKDEWDNGGEKSEWDD